MALRAVDRMFTFFLWQAEHGAAVGAFAIHVRFAVAEFVFLQLEEAREFAHDLQKFPILDLSAVNVSREKAEQIQCDQEKLQYPKNDALQEYIDDQQGKICPKQRLIQCIVEISAVQKTSNHIPEFHFGSESFLLPEVFFRLLPLFSYYGYSIPHLHKPNVKFTDM